MFLTASTPTHPPFVFIYFHYSLFIIIYYYYFLAFIRCSMFVISWWFPPWPTLLRFLFLCSSALTVFGCVFCFRFFLCVSSTSVVGSFLCCFVWVIPCWHLYCIWLLRWWWLFIYFMANILIFLHLDSSLDFLSLFIYLFICLIHICLLLPCQPSFLPCCSHCPLHLLLLFVSPLPPLLLISFLCQRILSIGSMWRASPAIGPQCWVVPVNRSGLSLLDNIPSRCCLSVFLVVSPTPRCALSQNLLARARSNLILLPSLPRPGWARWAAMLSVLSLVPGTPAHFDFFSSCLLLLVVGREESGELHLPTLVFLFSLLRFSVSLRFLFFMSIPSLSSSSTLLSLTILIFWIIILSVFVCCVYSLVAVRVAQMRWDETSVGRRLLSLPLPLTDRLTEWLLWCLFSFVFLLIFNPSTTSPTRSKGKKDIRQRRDSSRLLI